MSGLLSIRSGASCPVCGPDDGNFEFCEDCGPAECAFCGATVHRCLLSQNRACPDCEGEIS